MNKHLLSFFVLIAFALLAIFPASTKSKKVLSKPNRLAVHRTPAVNHSARVSPSSY
jgi:hypothetical protein